MQKVLVLGAGLVGKAMAIDLAKAFDVTSADRSDTALTEVNRHGIKPLKLDFADSVALKRAVEPFDLVVGAVPGFLGFEAVRSVIDAGKNLVDISFFPEDAFELDALARERGVVAVTDCGVAPGMGNLILGYHNQHMKVMRYECLVGGLPFVREWPYEYRAVFSPIDVIEEYTRPARFVQNGQLVVREALSDAELVDFPGIGTLESWNSDGLRSLLRTMSGIPDMIEKTLRYPGTIEYLRVLRETGFFSTNPVEVNGTAVRPIDLTAKLLFPKWTLKPGEEEFTVMRIRITGESDGVSKTIQYMLFDRTDRVTGTLSMARTTGYTCTAVANLVASGRYSRKGISPPEFVGEDSECFQFIMDYLAERGVRYTIDT